MANRKRAVSLIELLIYTMVAFLIATTALYIFSYARKTSTAASSGFNISQDVVSAIRRLRRDLQESSLQSIRYFSTGSSPQLVMASAHDDSGQFQISRYGVPQWSRYVCYALLPDTKNIGLTSLIRFEVSNKFSDHCPAPAAEALKIPAKFSAVAPSVMAAHFSLGARADGMQEGQLKSSDPDAGGLHVRFIRRDNNGNETSSPLNPNQNDDTRQPGWSAGSTGLVEVHIQVAEINGATGKWSVIDLPIRAAPRH